MEEGKRQPVDWDAVAIDIRAGILTDRQIGAKYGRSHGAIQQYAKKHGIERDLTERIQQKTKEKLAKNQLASIASQKASQLTQEQAIDVASTAAATIVIKQQGRLGRHLSVSSALISELESQTIDRELYERLGEMMYAPDDKGSDKLNELYRKVISTSSRIDSHKKAVETEKILIALERQAFSLDSGEEKLSDSIADAIRKARQ